MFFTLPLSLSPSEISDSNFDLSAFRDSSSNALLDTTILPLSLSILRITIGWDLFKSGEISLTGLRSTASGDIIGVNGTSNVCHIGQITAARNGTILTGSMECFEAPAGGDPDINVHSATEGTGVEDGAISSLTETLLVNAGDATLGSKVYFSAVPAADEFLYLTLGDTTDADYTAGKLFIELMGYEA